MKNGEQPTDQCTVAQPPRRSKRRRIVVLLIFAVPLAVAVVLGLAGRGGPLPTIKGNLSPKDVAEIRRAVRRARWLDCGACLKERNVKDLFRTSIPDLVAGRVHEIRRSDPSLTSTDLAVAISRSPFSKGQRSFFLGRETNGWICLEFARHYRNALPPSR